MIKSTNRPGTSDSMRVAILADEIARSLREVSLHKRVPDRDRRIIAQAVELLTEMRRGQEANGHHNQPQSGGAALPYAHALQAVQAMRLHRGSLESIEKLFEVLVTELKDVQDERSFDVRYVENFFIAVRDVALHMSCSDYSGIFLHAA
jgi:hypothetical protein